jgi:hypothetical protein
MNKAFFVDSTMGFASKLRFGLISLNPIAIGTIEYPEFQSDCAIAIGDHAGFYNQGEYAIAIGESAGRTNQSSLAIAIGAGAGESNQSQHAIALGIEAGMLTQGTNAIAIGFNAGQITQGSGAISIGFQAGRIQQGTQSIAIGTLAGASQQAANSIVISATGTVVTGAIANATYIAPLRNIIQTTVLGYDTTTNEITYYPLIIAPFSLTSTWVALGDSFTAGGGWGTPWPTYLQNATSTTLINRGVSSTTADYIGQNIGNDFVSDDSYTNVSSIVMYGFNDIRNDKSLYNNAYYYAQMLVGQYLTLTVPRSKISDPRAWSKNGTWTNTPAYSYGVYTSQNGAFVEQIALSGRYYGFRLTALGGATVTTQILIDGTLITQLSKVQPICQSGAFHSYGIIIDMGSVASRSVRVVNLSSSGVNNYIDFCATWVDNDPLARQCLVCIPPTFNYAYTGSAPWNQPSDTKRLYLVQAIRDAVNSVSKSGLPISIHETSIYDGVVFSDQIHWTSNMAETHANQIIKNSIRNY